MVLVSFTRRWQNHTPQGGGGGLRFTACLEGGCEVADERAPLPAQLGSHFSNRLWVFGFDCALFLK